MRFVADCMLGRLARWLRALGFDASYYPRIDDAVLLSVARREGRTVLTRDTGIAARKGPPPVLLVAGDRWEDQLVQVLAAFDLKASAAPFTRCLDCNAPLKPLAREDARNLASPFVVERAGALAVCPACGRVLWKGTHAADMEARIRAVLESVGAGDPKAGSGPDPGKKRARVKLR